MRHKKFLALTVCKSCGISFSEHAGNAAIELCDSCEPTGNAAHHDAQLAKLEAEERSKPYAAPAGCKVTTLTNEQLAKLLGEKL